MKIKSRWLERLVHADKDRAERRATENFVAYWWDGERVREEVVRDVSTTGVFVCTSEKWPQGKTVWVTMQRRGPLEVLPERRMTAQLKAMRPLADGVGCMFVSVAEPEERAWEELVEHAAAVTGVPDMAGYAKVVAAVAFLHQICPDRTVLGLLRERLSSLRLKRALEMLHVAADLVRAEEEAEQLRVPQRLLEQILEAGSDAQEGAMGARWATLLARSCATAGKDASLGRVIEVMSSLTDAPLVVLADASERARQGEMKPGPACAAKVTMTLAELMVLTGLREIPVQKSVQQLAELGLLEQAERPLVTEPTAKVDVTPSAFGLWTYAATSQHRRTAEEFYEQPA